VNELFPEAVFDIGKRLSMRGLVYREVTCSMQHLQGIVLSSLRGLRRAKDPHHSDSRMKGEVSRNNTVAPAAFKMWVPAPLLLPLVACTATHGTGANAGSLSVS